MSRIRSLYRVPFRFVPTPTILIDEWLAELDGSEIKVYLAINRKTWGFRKSSDQIAIEQLVQMTGLSESTVKRCTKLLKIRGLLAISGSARHAKVYEILHGRCGVTHDTTEFPGGVTHDPTVVSPVNPTIDNKQQIASPNIVSMPRRKVGA